MQKTLQSLGCRSLEQAVIAGNTSGSGLAASVALSAPAGKDDDRTQGQRYHDALAEAMRQLGKCIVTCITQCGTRTAGTT